MIGETIVYLRHILDAMDSIIRYSSGKTEAEFLADDMRHKAVIRDLEVIGEAAKRLPLDWQEKFPDVPWRKMARMRDKLIHHYMGIEMETVWATATEIVPPLVDRIRGIVEQIEKDVDQHRPPQKLS
ncbi:MAG: DUF86 domain-containing protein [Elusimicrobia bacterium]|nr:DUF86 domain-containing protein [Elusimicrobiota bacterium]